MSNQCQSNSVHRPVASGRARGPVPPLKLFDTSVNPISTRGAHYPHPVICALPDFQTLRRPRIVCTRLDDDHQPCHIGLRLSKQFFEFSRAFFRFSFSVKSLTTSLAMSHWIETFSSKFLNFPALFRCRFSVKSLHHFICARASFIQFICEN